MNTTNTTSAPQGIAEDLNSAEVDSSRRQSVVDRRAGLNRRRPAAEIKDEEYTGLERRRGAGIRRADDRRQAEEGEMTAEQFEFVMAVETYKKINKRMFPTWTEVLEVITQLGYRKVESREIQLENCPEPDLFKKVA
ncbi:MAG TPA: hypothetical protein VGN17_28520 [Bryobacteraceae bacterium]|jgi:predicted transcriptional regulator